MILALATLFVAVCSAEYVPVPGAGMMPAHCVNSVPSGSEISRHPAGGLEAVFPDGSVHRYPPCNATRGPLPPDYDGWLAYTAYKDEKGFDAFLGDFSTPDDPAESPQVLYLFTGLQNINWIPKVDPEPEEDFDIIQPVLQYPLGFGSGWGVRSWYVTLKDGALASEPVEVKAGDQIYGNMSRTGPSSWVVESVNMRTNQRTVQSASNAARLLHQPWAYVTLECYGCNGCSTFPQKPSVFSHMRLLQGREAVKPKWDVTPRKPAKLECNEKAVVSSSSGDVSIEFRN